MAADRRLGARSRAVISITARRLCTGDHSAV